MADLTDSIIRAESGGNPFARNPRSSAGGLGQFIDSTWLATVKRHRPDVAAGKTDAQILQLKFDPGLAREMTAAYARDNQSELSRRGLPVSGGTTYLAHFAGPAGASAVLSADPATPVVNILPASAVAANPFLRNMTASDLRSWADNKASGTKTEGGATVRAASMGGGDAPGGSGMDRLKGALQGKSYDPGSIEGWGSLRKAGQDVAGKATSWQQALLGTITAGLGGYLEGEEGKKKKEFDAALMGAVAGATNPTEIARVMVQSPDERIKAAGLELLVKNVGQSPQITTIETKDQYGRPVKTPVIPDGQGGYKPVEIGGGGQQATGTPQMPQQPVEVPAAPAAAPQPSQPPSAAVAPSGPMLGSPDLPTQNIGQVGPSGIPQAQPQQGQPPQVVQQPPAPQQIPNGYREVPVNVNELPKPAEGMTYELGPNGLPMFNDAAKSFRMVSTAEAAERGKAEAGRDAEATKRQEASARLGDVLGELKGIENKYGRAAVERALGPWSAPASGEGTVSGIPSAVLNYIPQQIARGIGEVQAAMSGGASPTEVRDDVVQKLRSIATITKPFIRAPGEGVWSEGDQKNLDELVGQAARSRTLEELLRRADETKTLFEKSFGTTVPDVKPRERKASDPERVEDVSRRFYEEWFKNNPPPAPQAQPTPPAPSAPAQPAAMQGTPYVAGGPEDPWARYMRQFGF